MTRSRRSLLRAAGATAGAAAAAALAGCGDAFEDDAVGPAYRDWLHAPGAILDREHYGFSFVRTDAVAEHRGALSERTYGLYRNALALSGFRERLGIDFEATGSVLRYTPSAVIAADFDRGAVAAALADLGYAEDGEAGEFTRFVETDDARAVGVSEDRVVATEAEGGGREGAVASLATVVDAERGEGERYAETSEDFRRATDAVGTADLVTGQTFEARTDDPFAGNVASVLGLTFGDETTRLRRADVFENEDDPDTAALREYAEAQPGGRRGLIGLAETFELERNGRTVVYDADLDTGEI